MTNGNSRGVDALKPRRSAPSRRPRSLRPAHAQSGRVVVGTWGGDYARLLAKNVEDPILKPKGFEVAQDQANEPPRRTKMLAEKRLPRGTTDIQGLSAAEMYEMNEAGVAEPIDYSKLRTPRTSCRR